MGHIGSYRGGDMTDGNYTKFIKQYGDILVRFCRYEKGVFYFSADIEYVGIEIATKRIKKFSDKEYFRISYLQPFRGYVEDFTGIVFQFYNEENYVD